MKQEVEGSLQIESILLKVVGKVLCDFQHILAVLGPILYGCFRDRLLLLPPTDSCFYIYRRTNSTGSKKVNRGSMLQTRNYHKLSNL